MVPPSAFPQASSNFTPAPPPTMYNEPSQAHSPLSRSPTPPSLSLASPISPLSPSPIAPTTETYHTAADQLSPLVSSPANHGLPTPNTTPAPPGPRPLPQPVSKASLEEPGVMNFPASLPTWATMTPHAKPNMVLLSPPLPLSPQMATLPNDSPPTATTSATTTTTFTDGSVLEIHAPPNSSATGRSGESSSWRMANPHSPPTSRTHSRAPSRSPLVPSMVLPPSNSYSPPTSATKAAFFATPSHAYSPPPSALRPSFHSHSRSSDSGSKTSLYAQNATGSHSRPSLHAHSASASNIVHHTPSTSHSSLHSPAISHRGLPQSPAAPSRMLPSPAMSKTSLYSPPATQISFYPSPGSAPAPSASSYFPTHPRDTSPALAPSDPRNLIPPYIRGTGYDPYGLNADGRWNAVIEED
jgi:hypothetical protein